ncbi:extracellular solute-binding protein, partial [Candidatus Uhrbacteria bacterium]|nr:extracellular solute-binding protein [Candidatus Uhrbacteria bacterium]
MAAGLLAAAAAVLLLPAPGCGDGGQKGASRGAGKVVVFTSLDDMFSRPIVAEFEKKTGIQVDFVTDTEAVKTLGLVNRLISRKDNPEADVFWNNEVMNTIVLKNKGLLEKYVPANAKDIPAEFKDPEGYWTGFAARARVILYNTKMVKPEDAPKSIRDLAKPVFKGKAAIAKPLFGTTCTHAAALFLTLGEDKAKDLFKSLKANEVNVVPGNAMARNKVVDGECAVCLTDTDDAYGAILKKAPVEMVYPDQDGEGTLVIPNAVMLIKGGPNPENAMKLIDFLVTREVEEMLAKSKAAQIPVRPDIPVSDERFRMDKIRATKVDWTKVASQVEAM